MIIVLHELGHWLAARMVGEYPARIVFGKGHLLLRITIFKTKVNLYSKIYSGYILCVFKNNRNVIPRHLIYILGGPFINIIVGLLIIYTVPSTWSFRDHIAICLFFGYLQVFIGLANLYPNVSKTNGFPMYSDGLHIWKIIRGTYDGNITEVALNHFFEGEGYFHSKSYSQALEEYQYGLQAAQSLNDRDKSAVLINIAACYLQMEQFEKTFQILAEVENNLSGKEGEPYLAYIYSHYAWIYLVEDENEKATSYAKKAFGLSPDSEDIRFIWGILLVENQHWHDGEYLLKSLFDSDYPNTRTVLVAAYLALVYHHQHQEKKKARFLSFAQRHLDQLDKQDLIVYQRVLAKINSSSAQASVLDIANH